MFIGEMVRKTKKLHRYKTRSYVLENYIELILFTLSLVCISNSKL